MESFIVGLIIAAIIGAAVAYIIKEKKKGVRCIGCPSAGACAAKNKGSLDSGCGCNGSCGCHMDEE